MSQTGYLFRRELKNLLKEELTVATDSNLLSHFRFNGNLTDSSGNAASIGSSSGLQAFVAGLAREALQLSHVAGAFVYTASAVASATAHSAEVWLKVGTVPGALDDAVRIERGGGTISYRIGTDSAIVIHSATPGSTSSYTSTVKPTASFAHIVSVIQAGSIAHYINGLAATTSSFGLTASALTASLRTAASASYIYDDLRLWNKVLGSGNTSPQGQIQWHYQQMRVYDERPPHDEVLPPAVILELESDGPNEYLLGEEYFGNLSFKVDLLYEENKHQRIVNGETLSRNDLALWYAEELRRILWHTVFTTSVLNEDSRDVYTTNHQESYDQLYLYGCLGSFKISYKGA
jgi:hypothetical protein